MLPEGLGNHSCRTVGIVGRIEAETIHVVLGDPVGQHSVHVLLQAIARGLIVELRNISVGECFHFRVWVIGVAVAMHVILRMQTSQRIVPGSLVEHFVEDDLHAQAVGCLDQVCQVRGNAVAGVDRVKIVYRVGTVKGRMPIIGQPHGGNRHQPNDIDAEVLETGQLRGHSLKSVRRKDLRIDAIND